MKYSTVIIILFFCSCARNTNNFSINLSDSCIVHIKENIYPKLNHDSSNKLLSEAGREYWNENILYNMSCFLNMNKSDITKLFGVPSREVTSRNYILYYTHLPLNSTKYYLYFMFDVDGKMTTIDEGFDLCEDC